MARYLYFLPAVAYMGLIFYLSTTLPPPPLQDWPDWHDISILHIIEYGGLATLLMYGFQRGTDHPLTRTAMASAIISSLYGLSDEWHQSFVPERVASTGDVIADVIGSVIAVLAYAAAIQLGWLPKWLLRSEETHTAIRDSD